MDFESTAYTCSAGDPLPKLLKPFHFVEQNGRKGYK